MRLASVWNIVRRDLRHFGLARTLCDVAFRAINLLVYFRVVRGLAIEQLPRDSDDDDVRGLDVEWRFLTDEQLAEFAADGANHISAEFLVQALVKGDRCYAALAGGRLVAYSWYSHEPTEADGLLLRFRPDYVYMYKAFTAPDYRGRRLYEIGVSQALDYFRAQGFAGLISDVELHNFGSLRSLRRLGFVEFGQSVILKLGARALIRTSRGCKQYGYSYQLPGVANREAEVDALA